MVPVVSPVKVAVMGVSDEPVAWLGVGVTVVTPVERSDAVEYWKLRSEVAFPLAFTLPFKTAPVLVIDEAALVVAVGAGVVVKFKVLDVEVPATLIAMIL